MFNRQVVLTELRFKHNERLRRMKYQNHIGQQVPTRMARGAQKISQMKEYTPMKSAYYIEKDPG